MKKGRELSMLHIGWEVFLELLFAVIIGVAIFIILKLTLKKRLPEEEEEEKSSAEHEFDSFLSTVLSDHPTPSVEVLLIMTGVIAIGIAGAMNFHLPFLITAVVAGFLIANFHSHAIFESMKIRNVMPVLNLFFFALIGANVQIETFSGETIYYVGAYVILRSVGKLAGNWIGCRITGQDPKITAALPKLMLPQAGMAAVETILVATMLNDSEGTLIFNTIIPALVIFELGGAWLSEKTLMKWKHWTTGERDALRVDSGTEKTSTMLDTYLEGRVIEMLAATRDQALFELSKKFVTEGIIDDVQVVMPPLLEREKLATTAIGEGVALPHCRSSNVKRTVVCAGICRTPIEWKSPDKKPVDLIFLIITPETDPEQHLAVLKIISKALFEGSLHDYLHSVQG
jgi:mannitol/fructose-specific phosphotransferase system IIA component (Ntr-type)